MARIILIFGHGGMRGSLAYHDVSSIARDLLTVQVSTVTSKSAFNIGSLHWQPQNIPKNIQGSDHNWSSYLPSRLVEDSKEAKN